MEEAVISLLAAIGFLVVWYIIDKSQSNEKIRMLEHKLKILTSQSTRTTEAKK